MAIPLTARWRLAGFDRLHRQADQLVYLGVVDPPEYRDQVEFPVDPKEVCARTHCEEATRGRVAVIALLRIEPPQHAIEIETRGRTGNLSQVRARDNLLPPPSYRCARP